MEKNKQPVKKYKLKGVKPKTSDKEIKSDVNGSYTGVPTEPYDEKPIQDADDL